MTTVFVIILFSLCVISLLAAAAFLLLHHIFEHRPDMLDKTVASRKKTKHKKDVTIYEHNYRGPIRAVMFIKNLSESLYEYKVDGKKYRIRYTNHVTANQMPYTVQVVYLKKLPRIAYVKTDTDFHKFGIYAFAALMFSVLYALSAMSLIFQ